MLDRAELIWLFFRTSGRLNRAAYIVSFLFMLTVVSFPFYQYLRQLPDLSSVDMTEMTTIPLTAAAEFWSMVFLLTMPVFLWAHITTSIKRLHDLGKPGILAVALFVPLLSIAVFIALCVFPGDRGPNRYGRLPNAPA